MSRQASLDTSPLDSTLNLPLSSAFESNISLGLPPVSWRFPSHMFQSFIENCDDLTENEHPNQQDLLRHRQYQQKQQRLRQQYHQEYQKQEFHPDLLQVQKFQRRHGEFYLKNKNHKQQQQQQRMVQPSISEQVQRYREQQEQLYYIEQQQQQQEDNKGDWHDSLEVGDEKQVKTFSYQDCLRSVNKLEVAMPAAYQEEERRPHFRTEGKTMTAFPVTRMLAQQQEGPIMLHLAGVTTDCSSDDVSLMSLRRHRKDLSMDSGIQGSSCDLADSSDPEETSEELTDNKSGSTDEDYKNTQNKLLSTSEVLDGETYNLVEEVYVEEDPKNRFQKDIYRASVRKCSSKRTTVKVEKSLQDSKEDLKFRFLNETNLSNSLTTLSKASPTPIPAKRSLSNVSQCKVAPPRLFLKNNQSRRSSVVSSTKYMSLDSLDQTTSIIEERNVGLQQLSSSSFDMQSKSSLPTAIDDLIDQALDAGCREELQSVSASLDELVVQNETNLGTDLMDAKPKQNDSRFVVVAIDFGTTFTGYAFTFIRDPEVNIHMMRKWEGGDPGLINQKIPTTLLLTPSGEFHSFGYCARDYFHDLDPQEAKKWLYFDKFKMVLHHDHNVNRACELTAANGSRISAVVIFGLALKHLKELVLTELSDQAGGEVKAEDVRWVVTVPAIWRQPAKQLMREAAYKAEISSPDHPEGLLIALEPECASICCRKLRLNQLVPERAMEKDRSLTWSSTASLPVMDHTPSELLLQDSIEGMRYMVVDCGGGTVDITVHELSEQHGTLRELHKATGGPWGSIRVDHEFVKLLEEIFGSDFMTQFKLKRPAAFVELMLSFEARKRSASPLRDAALNVIFPFGLIDYYRKFSGKEIEQAVKKLGRKEISWSSQGMLRIQPSVMRELFGPTVAKILNHIRDVLDSPSVGNIEYLFLVGGFAESQILQHEVRTAFKGQVNVIIPQGVALTILRGAVLFGLNPKLITTRRSKQTYGVGVMKRFDACVHPREKLVVKDGLEWCADLLDKFVTTEQPVEMGETVVRRYTPACSQQTQIIINIYTTNVDNVTYITDPGVSRCGILSLHLANNDDEISSESKRREIHTRMVFGGTEISASALDVSSGQYVQMEVDFLTT